MTIVVVNNGEDIALSYLVNKVTTPENLIYKLFATNVTPGEGDTASTYTEAAGGGYSTKAAITGSTWTVSGGTASNSDLVWTFTGALTTNPTIYGYYVVRASTGDLVFVETFTSFTPAANGDTLTITPQITAS